MIQALKIVERLHDPAVSEDFFWVNAKCTRGHHLCKMQEKDSKIALRQTSLP